MVGGNVLGLVWIRHLVAIHIIRYRYAIPIDYIIDFYYFSFIMARQKGLIKLTGTIGEVNFYVLNGVGYARKAGGGFSGKAIKTKASMQRVRENASEFGHCSMVKKQFRLALMPFLEGIKGRDLHARLMQLFLELKALDSVSECGKRRVCKGLLTAKGKRLLQQFVFTPQHTLLDALNAKATFDWTTQRLDVSEFGPNGYKVPKTATHIGVTLGVLDFDFDSLDYNLKVSATHFIDIDAGATSFMLEPEAVVAPTHVGVAVLGLCFFEVIDGEVYDLPSFIGGTVLDC